MKSGVNSSGYRQGQLKADRIKRLSYAKQKNKINSSYLKGIIHTTCWIGVDLATRTQYLEFYPSGGMKK